MYLSDLYEDELEIAVKVVIVGNGAVGKSSMIQRYCRGIYTQNYKKTIGVDFLEKRLKMHNEDVRLMLWDTAGQEEFDAITKAYYRGAQACVVAFSTTDRNSFEAVKKWKRKVEDECGTVPMVLVQNKIDLMHEAQVDGEEVERLAKDLKMKLIRTSVKEDLNVASVFHYLADNYVTVLRRQMYGDEDQHMPQHNPYYSQLHDKSRGGGGPGYTGGNNYSSRNSNHHSKNGNSYSAGGNPHHQSQFSNNSVFDFFTGLNSNNQSNNIPTKIIGGNSTSNSAGGMIRQAYGQTGYQQQPQRLVTNIGDYGRRYEYAYQQQQKKKNNIATNIGASRSRYGHMGSPGGYSSSTSTSSSSQGSTYETNSSSISSAATTVPNNKDFSSPYFSAQDYLSSPMFDALNHRNRFWHSNSFSNTSGERTITLKPFQGTDWTRKRSKRHFGSNCKLV